MSLPFIKPQQWISIALLALGVGSTALQPCHALDVAAFRAEDVVPILSEFKTSAKLSANQQILWQQTETRVRTLLHQRETRQREMQERVKKRLQEKAPELRDLAKAMDQDDAITAQENQQLREYWMTLHDALNDEQREALTVLMNEQLLRQPGADKEHRSGPGKKPASTGRHGNKGGQRPPGAGQ